jgi:branched-chain amino acid transport system ATP-binding protein
MAVSDVDLDVNEGEILGLIGPNGSGKTTLLNLINGLLRPSRGKVIFRGEDVSGFPAYLITRKGIGRTFQQNVLFRKRTVWENVLIAHEVNDKHDEWLSFLGFSRSRSQEKEARESTLRLLDEMGLISWKDRLCSDLPHGIQRMVGLAIARAVKPDVMLLDEPFGGMNLSEIANMVRVIEQMKSRGVTLLLVEHRMKVVMAVCDRIVVLNFGRKIAEGLPGEVRNNEEVIKAYLGDRNFDF